MLKPELLLLLCFVALNTAQHPTFKLLEARPKSNDNMLPYAAYSGEGVDGTSGSDLNGAETAQYGFGRNFGSFGFGGHHGFGGGRGGFGNLNLHSLGLGGRGGFGGGFGNLGFGGGLGGLGGLGGFGGHRGGFGFGRGGFFR